MRTTYSQNRNSTALWPWRGLKLSWHFLTSLNLSVKVWQECISCFFPEKSPKLVKGFRTLSIFGKMQVCIFQCLSASDITKGKQINNGRYSKWMKSCWDKFHLNSFAHPASEHCLVHLKPAHWGLSYNLTEFFLFTMGSLLLTFVPP